MATTLARTQFTAPSHDSYAPPAALPAPRRRGARVLRALVLLAVVGVSMEVTARVEDLVRYGTPLLSPFRSQGDLTIRDADGIHGRPNARFQKWVMNGLGMRGPEAAAAKPAGTWRVIAVGASETFGLYESVGKEFPRQLEDSLQAAVRDGRCRCAGVRRAEVLNAALAGMTLPTALQDVQNRLRRLDPDVVLFYPTPSVYLWDEPPLAARPDSSATAGHIPAWTPAWPRMIARFKSQAKVVLPGFAQTWLRRREIARATGNRDASWQYRTVPADRLALYEQDLRRFVGTVRAIGATPVLASHGNMFAPGKPMNRDELYKWAKFYPRATGETIVAFDSAARDVTLRVAADSSVALADAMPVLHAHEGKVFADFSHFTDLGSAVIAGTMSRTLLGVAGKPLSARADPLTARE